MSTQLRPEGQYIPTQPGPVVPIARLRRQERSQGVPSTATRHLSAGAYLDEDFCRESLAEAYHQKRRLVAPSYGFDLPTVLWHCLQARRINLVRDAVIASVFLVCLCVNPVGVALAAALLLMVHLATTAWRLSRDFMTQIRTGNISGQLQTGMRTAYLAIGSIVLLSLLGLTAGYTLTAALSGSFESYGDPELQAEQAAAALISLGSTALVIFVAFGAPVGADIWRQTRLSRLAPGKATHMAATNARMQQIREQEHGNVTVYSGFRPFVGSGNEMETTGYALRIVAKETDPTRPHEEWEREFNQPPFTAFELIGHVRGRLAELTQDARPERRVPGLSVRDRVFMAGTEVETLTPFLYQGDIDNIVIPEPVGPVRHYLSAQVQSWDGELVTTVYLHVALQGRTLYLETSTWALAPCDERFRSIDYVVNQGGGPFLRALLRGFVNAPRIVVRSGLNLVQAGLEAVTTTTTNMGTIGESVHRGYDYGARFSVRERGSLGLARNDFQVQDAFKYKRIIERRAIAAVLDFLDSRGVDTSELRQRAAAILNQGTIIGSVNNSQFRDINTGAPANEGK